MTQGDAIITWARGALGAPQAVAETIVETPWSRVLKIPAGDKNYYLKQPARGLFIEADIIATCRSLCGITAIPGLVAQDDALHCFLMTDCGDKSLRTIFDGKLDAALIAQGIRAYTQVQRATAPHVDAFLGAGAPDWRLDIIPRLYSALVDDGDFMAAHGLDAAQIKNARAYAATVAASCTALAAYNIPECLTHSDIHDNNMILGADGRISIIDLGETAIDHPFLSLAWLLRRTGFRYPSAAAGGADYQTLFDACFDGWGIAGDDLQRAFRHANTLLPVYGIISHLRLMQAAGSAIEDVPRMRGRLRELFLLTGG